MELGISISQAKRKQSISQTKRKHCWYGKK